MNSYNRTGSQLLFDYLSEIHEKKVIILNTNLEFSRWVNVLYDEQMTAALVGRLMHHCHLIRFREKTTVSGNPVSMICLRPRGEVDRMAEHEVIKE